MPCGSMIVMKSTPVLSRTCSANGCSSVLGCGVFSALISDGVAAMVLASAVTSRAVLSSVRDFASE